MVQVTPGELARRTGLSGKIERKQGAANQSFQCDGITGTPDMLRMFNQFGKREAKAHAETMAGLNTLTTANNTGPWIMDISARGM